MSNMKIFGSDSYPAALKQRLVRLSILISAALLALLILFLIMWHTFFKYVPPGKMLVTINQFGKDRDNSRTMSQPEEKGVQEQVLGEGWHFVLPIVYKAELHDVTRIDPGEVGIVTARGGQNPGGGHILTDKDDEKGIRRRVLSPGTYRLNPYGYTVEKVKAIEVHPGYVGVQRRLLGDDAPGRFATKKSEKGFLREVLQPGLYFINTKEYETIPREVGIYQTSYHFDKDPQKNTGLTLPSSDGYDITLDCTVEWEVDPKSVVELVARHVNRVENASGKEDSELKFIKQVEQNVVNQQARKICRDRGFNYGAQEFLDGDKREQFQSDFESELKKNCEKQQVIIKSAYIRNIVIPESFLQLKRERQLAIENKVTNEILQVTAKSDAAVQREKSTIGLAVAEVKAQTSRMVATIEVDVANLEKTTDEEINLLTAEFNAKIATLDAERTVALAEAESTSNRLKETAKSALYKMKLDLFQGDVSAYLRYSMAQQLNPNLALRIFQSGPGTFWTNMGDKGPSLMISPGSAPQPVIRDPGKPVVEARKEKTEK